jgi:hypothetical protein
MRPNGTLFVCGMTLVTVLSSARIVAQTAASNAKGAVQASVTIEKPKARSVTGGSCGVVSGGTFSGVWGPSALPTLAFTIGPGSAMADMMHANKAKFTGPGRYTDVIIALYLGKTALEDSYAGLGTVVIGADGRTGSFTLNNGTASGRFDCGAAPSR